MSEKSNLVYLKDRQRLRLEGVLQVISFEPCQILLVTNMGSMVILGKELHISHLLLDEEKVQIDGHVDSISFVEDIKGEKKEKRKSLVKKLMS